MEPFTDLKVHNGARRSAPPVWRGTWKSAALPRQLDRAGARAVLKGSRDFIHKRKWHKKQLTKENADETVDVKLNVSLTAELDAILLAFAGHVKVFSPAPLRERMREFGDALKRDNSRPPNGR